MIVRPERLEDTAAARAVQVAAFEGGGSEPMEARLLDELRRCDGWLPALSWVAVIGEEVLGHAVGSRGHIGLTPCVGLGPIGVLPDQQRHGVGSALMHALIGAAEVSGEPVICLLGDPAYYARFGFVRSTEVGIEPPEPAWGAYFQALTLSNWAPSMTGTFRYASPFDTIS